jgi:RND family efflux transporter MFP subunit
MRRERTVSPRRTFPPLRCSGLALLALALASCGEPPAPEASPVRPVKLLTLGQGEAGTLEYPGQVRAAQRADMAFEVAGRIVEFPVKEGTRVKAGQVLARLDPRDYEAELAKARTNAAKGKADYDRYRSLYEKGVSPKAELERYQTFYDNTQATLRIAAKAVEDTVLRAPFDGVMAQKLVEDFANVQAKQPVLVLEDDSSLRIDVAVPERDFARMRPAASLEERSARVRPRVIVSGVPGREFPARISEFTTTADPVTRTYKATFAFERPRDVNVLPGMTARVRIDTGGAEAGAPLLVPVQAVAEDSGGAPYVWTVDPASMKVSKTTVEIGALTGSWIEIRKGLSPGQTLATSGVHQLREGMTVRPFER